MNSEHIENAQLRTIPVLNENIWEEYVYIWSAYHNVPRKNTGKGKPLTPPNESQIQYHILASFALSKLLQTVDLNSYEIQFVPFETAEMEQSFSFEEMCTKSTSSCANKLGLYFTHSVFCKMIFPNLPSFPAEIA